MSIDGLMVDRWVVRPAREVDQKALEIDLPSFGQVLAPGLPRAVRS